MPQAVNAASRDREQSNRNARMADPEKTPMLTDGVKQMDEAAFNALAEAELARIEHALEAFEDDIELEVQAGGVLELEFENGSKVVINRHTAAREIWVAAKSGGFHFRPEGGRWLGTRDGVDLHAALTRVLSEQAGRRIDLAMGE